MSIRPNRSAGTRDDSKEEIMGRHYQLRTLRQLLDKLRGLCRHRNALGPSDEKTAIELEIQTVREHLMAAMREAGIAYNENVTDDELVRALEAALLREEMRVRSRGQERGLEL